MNYRPREGACIPLLIALLSMVHRTAAFYYTPPFCTLCPRLTDLYASSSNSFSPNISSRGGSSSVYSSLSCP